jgi:predicted RNase H-like nuclease (RuvC/YqgF family)
MEKVHTCKVCKLSEPDVEFYNGKFSICKTCYTEKNKADYERRKLLTSKEKPETFEEQTEQDDLRQKINMLENALVQVAEHVKNYEDMVKNLLTKMDDKDKEIEELREKISLIETKPSSPIFEPDNFSNDIPMSPKSPEREIQEIQEIYDKLNKDSYNVSALRCLPQTYNLGYIPNLAKKSKEILRQDIMKKIAEKYNLNN